MIKLLGQLAYSDLKDYSRLLSTMKKRKVVGLRKYEEFVGRDENYRNEKLLQLIERKNKLKAEKLQNLRFQQC